MVGKITIVTESSTQTFGAADAALHATLRVQSDTFWVRVALFTDLGLAEAYMYGDGALNHRRPHTPC
jgi:cyclopropane-fatty-acyl-phospholipid synthase